MENLRPAPILTGRGAARLGLAALAILSAAASASAQAPAFTKADSGWVPIFNGRNLDGLYSRMYSKEITDIPDTVFKARDSMIVVSPGGGHIGTDRKYSHYRMRVQYKFDKAGDYNAGLMYHVDEVPPRMSGNWSRSIECQMRQTDGGDIFSIVQVTFESKVRSGSNTWDPEGVMVTAPAHSRDLIANPHTDVHPQWNRMEVVVRGSDSAAHIINGSLNMKAWNIRIPDPANAGKYLPYGRGALALQAEGAGISYRGWEVMELPDSGPDRLQRLFLTRLNQGEQVPAGSSQQITWKTLGDVKKVSLFFNMGDGQGWEMAADNITNTGSFSWMAPTETTRKLRVMVSAAPWVLADTSDGDNEIVPPMAVRPRKGLSGATWPGEVATPDQDLRDAKGRQAGGRPGRIIRFLGE